LKPGNEQIKEKIKKEKNRVTAEKNRGRVETQPRFKIQYPMKNQGKDAVN